MIKHNKVGSNQIKGIICQKCMKTLEEHSKKELQRHFAEVQGTFISYMEEVRLKQENKV